MTKRRLTAQETHIAQELYDEAEYKLRRLVEYLDACGQANPIRFTNRYGSSQLVTVKANENTGNNGVYVVRMTVPNSTGEKFGDKLEKNVKLDSLRKYEGE